MMAKREPLSSVPGGPDPAHVGSITLGGDIGRANSSRHSGRLSKIDGYDACHRDGRTSLSSPWKVEELEACFL
jgi:hypothetical protein